MTNKKKVKAFVQFVFAKIVLGMKACMLSIVMISWDLSKTLMLVALKWSLKEHISIKSHQVLTEETLQYWFRKYMIGKLMHIQILWANVERANEHRFCAFEYYCDFLFSSTLKEFSKTNLNTYSKLLRHINFSCGLMKSAYSSFYFLCRTFKKVLIHSINCIGLLKKG